MQHLSVTFDFGSARVFSVAIFETYFSYHKIYGLVQLISKCTYCFQLTELSSLTDILQLTTTSNKIF